MVRKYDKLVRDRIPSVVSGAGKVPVTRIVEGDELKAYLERKLTEEVSEFLESTENKAEELADVLEVLIALANLEGLSFNDLEDIRRNKSDKRGGFVDGVVLLEVRDSDDQE